MCIRDSSIIKPIIKDQNKNADDANNIRPLSISNCLSQLFEKLILKSSQGLHKIHKNQFGFKPKTSCNHAIFVMKETVLNYTEKGSNCRMASLDAEKAFDKVWRDGLFYKLYFKIIPTYWILLKKYYDLSQGTILLPNLCFSDLFGIDCGVKQGGIISPFLFNIFIDDLISECSDSNLGALYFDINTSIIVYADDILLISPLDTHLQLLLDICSQYSIKWRIKFNPHKSNIISFGDYYYPEKNFLLSNQQLLHSKSIRYLGIEINNILDFDSTAKNKFKNVQKSLFSLSFLGLKPGGISPFLQSFIYKTFCLTQFTYALETTTLLVPSREYLNISQNNLIRLMIGLDKFCHMTNVLKSLKIFNFEQLYIFTKLSFLKSIKNNELSLYIFKTINEQEIRKKTKSFKIDIQLLEKKFSTNVNTIFLNPSNFIKTLKETFIEENGIVDSITHCFQDFKNFELKKTLKSLIKPKFLNDDLESLTKIFYSILVKLPQND